MSKDEVLKIMLDSINADNRELCEKNGMTEKDIQSQIEQSQPSLVYIIGNMYDKLKEAGVLV